uniref:Uncharacterized protein n=1 Tax=Oryza glaberrima TaxID=4538 RepID=I1QAW9_ORYGL
AREGFRLRVNGEGGHSTEKDGSGCNFWYWEEAYIKFLKRSGFIDEATCAELLKEAKMKDGDEMKKSSAQEFKKELDVGHFKQLENMIFILTKMMVLLKLIQAGATAGTEIQHETEFAPEIEIAPTEKTCTCNASPHHAC